ncbi:MULTISPECIES: response regulator [unclassified Rhizobium]|uniref:response regulator n=1 Tax=unclassified Rhizobium TaxID=2613769 RepID=UPI00104501EB|nr:MULTISPECIES: response regulator [unclassified Rhizobium]
MDKLSGKRVLIVEDEMLVALLMEDFILQLGCEIAGIAMRLEPALDLARTLDIDIAILDINLAGKQSFPIAHQLETRGIPFVFASGYGAAGLEGSGISAPVLQKPFNVTDVGRLLASAL